MLSHRLGQMRMSILAANPNCHGEIKLSVFLFLQTCWSSSAPCLCKMQILRWIKRIGSENSLRDTKNGGNTVVSERASWTFGKRLRLEFDLQVHLAFLFKSCSLQIWGPSWCRQNISPWGVLWVFVVGERKHSCRGLSLPCGLPVWAHRAPVHSSSAVWAVLLNNPVLLMVVFCCPCSQMNGFPRF